MIGRLTGGEPPLNTENKLLHCLSAQTRAKNVPDYMNQRPTMDETKARALADKLSTTAPDDDLVPWINLILTFEAEVRREAFAETIAAISSEDMVDETDDPTDAAYSRAIQDCKDVIRALPAQADPEAP